ncbi:L-seryl-tRNA(Sec) selenium transferase [Candidatus Magnetomonas plexicatena]|uniref:L-seryl-tRNA(Sec) selenium transferase n=1 Tax=Candidatus Magnetomonas plexicatena TaxID=2552947 RepID=UPI00110387A9|nr:L-seryl-tRNA(Sec) selenium transferase [Nitrospirales bacterium LBB_01]
MQQTSNKTLRGLPSVDKLLQSEECQNWLKDFPRRVVLKAIRESLEEKRTELLQNGSESKVSGNLFEVIEKKLTESGSFSLKPVINATGIVIHTNLGRAPLSDKTLKHLTTVASGYSNLEYDLNTGSRGKRHVHLTALLKELTGAEDAMVVNNNAAAVFLALTALTSQRKEVIVSRGELIEIGGSFRIPDIMAAGGAILKEVGTANKTHLYDYENAISDNTGLILKVHRSNFKLTGFTEEVETADLVKLAAKTSKALMYDLGSGCLIDLKPWGIHTEPVVSDVVKAGVDIVTFSGDKLLGGPQCGVIAGKQRYIEILRKHPLARALRVDKFTISAMEAVLMDYVSSDDITKNIPVLEMLLCDPAKIKERALKIKKGLKSLQNFTVTVREDDSEAGGGSLPGVKFKTYTVQVKHSEIPAEQLQKLVRDGKTTTKTPLIGRIKDDTLILDVRTIFDSQIQEVIEIFREVN